MNEHAQVAPQDAQLKPNIPTATLLPPIDVVED
jgi:hypothetical protein